MRNYTSFDLNIDEFLEQIGPRFSSSKSAPLLRTVGAEREEDRIQPAPLEAYSFRARMSAAQQAVLNALATFVGVALLLQPALAAALLSWILFAIFSLLILTRLTLIIAGLGARVLCARDMITPAFAENCPKFTVMVAGYHESNMMAQLALALRRLSWPADKVEFFILLEADDPDTIDAAKAADFPHTTRVIVVPPGGPKTKPNALNYGLTLARGDIVTVYDVEDQPHPDQLRAVCHAFRHAPANIVCVQAPLVARNETASWFASQWALEYGVQFGLLIPSLSIYRMPILLGGTSNHIRRDALLALGGWDAWNVTEDADLGMRMARAGLLTESVRTPTFETAPTRFRVWWPQRSRWLKGFLQTWLVLMRDPVTTCRQMGAPRFTLMQVTLGGAVFSPLAHLPFSVLVALAFWSGELAVGFAGFGLLAVGLLVGLVSDLLAPGRWSWVRLFAIITRPFYWPLHSLAAYRALWELANHPFFWAKTPHRPNDAEPQPFYSTGSSASASP